jgi:SNF2 family DNA or RNA helicase
VVVFAHHTAVVDELVRGLKGYNAVSITGATPAAMRDYRVQLFQDERQGVRVIICNIVAGGTGITLTAASEVVFVELSPVPGENAQAADRVHRIGQEKKVRVRVIALAGSIDEDFTELLRRKTKMIREVLQ